MILFGFSDSSISGDKTAAPFGTSRDYWIVKLDSNGVKLWDEVYGGTDDEGAGATQTYTHQFHIIPDNNESFVLSGTTKSSNSGNISDTSRGDSDIWIVKIDSAGNKIWDKR